VIQAYNWGRNMKNVDEACQSITNAAKQINEQLELAKVALENDASTFAQKPGHVFGPAIGIYKRLFNNFGVTSRRELDEHFKILFGNEEVRDAHQDLVVTEDDWDEFLKQVDQHLIGNKSKITLKEGDVVPDDLIQLVNVRSGACADIGQLCPPGVGSVHLVLLRHLA